MATVSIRVTSAIYTPPHPGDAAQTKTILWEGIAVFPDGVEHHRGPISLCSADPLVGPMAAPRAALKAADPNDAAAIKAVLALDVQRVIDEIEERHSLPVHTTVSLL